MSNKQAVLLIKSDKKETLSKQQQAFNRWIKEIDKLQDQIEAEKERLGNIYGSYMRELQPKYGRMAGLQLEMARLLSDSVERFKYGKRQREILREAILVLCDSAFAVVEPDVEAESLYDRWADSTYEEEVRGDQLNMADMMSRQIESMFGINVDFTEFDGSEASYAQVEEQLRQQLGDGFASNFAQKERKKSKRQLAKEVRERELASEQRKSIRAIYISLAKALHPDTAYSEMERVERDMLMKEVTVAYQQKDLPALLRLEMQWIGKASNFQEAGDEKLELYITALKQQVQELKHVYTQILGDPRYMILGPLRHSAEKKAMREIRSQGKLMKQRIEAMESDCRRLANRPLKSTFMELAEIIVQFAHQGYMEDFDDDW